MNYLRLFVLCIFCFGGHIHGATSAIDPNYRQQMCDSIRSNDLKRIKELIESSHIELEEPLNDYSYNTPLLEAAYRGRFSTIQYFIDAGADIYAVNDYHSHVLNELMRNRTLSENQSIELTQYLVQKGFDVNMMSLKGKTALMYACEGRRLKLFKALMDLGADIHAQSKSGSTVFMSAVKADNVPVMEILIQNGVDIDAINKFGHNAFLLSINKGCLNAFNLFVKKLKVNINQYDPNGMTPVICAAFYNQSTILQRLIRMGADINQRTSSPVSFQVPDSNALFISLHPKYESIPAGATALTFAKRLGNQVIVHILQQAGGVE